MAYNINMKIERGGVDMVITATEFKSNIGKYLSLVSTGDMDILITKNGKHVAKLSSPKEERVEIAKSLIGIIPDDGMTIDDLKEERLMKYANTN